MILIALGTIMALVTATVAVSVFWRNIAEWIMRLWKKVEAYISNAVEGVKTFIVKTQEGFKNCVKFYSCNKVTQEWQETVVRKSINENEIEPDILQRIKNRSIGSEIETTKEMLSCLER